MKTFADTSFFLLFDEILRKDKPKASPAAWSASGVTWQHSRHTYEGLTYGVTTEVFEATNSGKSGWSLIVVKEHWWAGRNGEVIRSAHWAKPMHGSRAAIMSWLKARQRELEGTL
jgi:hypothetical protein